MTLIDLKHAALTRGDSPEAIYLVGVGGPEDESGIGDVTSFTWRYCLVEPVDGTPIVLSFSTMPKMMAFTREVNGRSPFTVPTEALRTEFSTLGVADLRLAIDPAPEDLEGWLRTGRLVTRGVPELQG